MSRASKILTANRDGLCWSRLLLGLALLVLILLSTALPAQAAETWRDSNYPYRREITLENDNMDSTLSNFTLLIRLVDGDAVDKDNIADGRYTFYDSSGNQLDFQNEAYSEGASYVNMETWVEIGTLNADDTTTTDDSIWIYYGYDGGDQDDGTGAWNADGNWQGIWHLNEETAGTGTANLYKDSTTNGYDGDDEVSATGQDGVIGAGQEFDGSDDYVDLGSYGTGTGNVTVCAWVNVADASGHNSSYGAGVVSNNNGDAQGDFTLSVDDDYRPFFIYWDTGGGADADGELYPTSTNLMTQNQWHHICGLWNGSVRKLYLDGAEISSTGAYTSGSGWGTRQNIGRSFTSTPYFFNGLIDDVRVSNTARSTAWIKYAHANMGGQADNELIVGSEEALFDISGRVFEDADFTGTASTWDGGTNDLALENVDVELYTSADVYQSSTTTDSNGDYSFLALAEGDYKVRVRAATIGDADTPPQGGIEAGVPATWPYPLAELAWADGAALYGGQSATADDTDTADDAGPGDTYVNITLSGADETGVDFGFAYNLIVNVEDDTQADASQSQQGSLRQFIKNANAIGTAGGTTANASEFRMQVATNQVDGADNWWRITTVADLPILTYAGTTVDASTQRTNSGSDSNTRGPEIEIDGAATYRNLRISGGSSTVREFAIGNGLEQGIELTTSGSNTIEGNYIGISAVGTTARGNTLHGIKVESSSNTIGGTTAAQRNVISGNDRRGILIKNSASGNTVQGNYIGTNASATAAVGNTYDGVVINDGATGNTIGGTAVGAGNVISGNTLDGIQIGGSTSSGNTVQGNYIGTNATGTADLGNGGHGIIITNSADGNTFGGTAAGAANVIAFNTGDGVFLEDAASDGNLISANSIYLNGGLGIDIDPDGIGTGSGANNDKARPTISSVVASGSDFTVTATVTSGDVIEFFRVNNAAAPVVTADGTGAGEGFLYLGSAIDNGATSGPHIQAGSDGDGAGGTIVVTLLASGLDGGDDITATARDGSNNTSEFSDNVEATVAVYAVTSTVAEISPNDVSTSSTANAFSYDIGVTIGGSDSGVNRVAITVPGSFGAPTISGVLVDGSGVAHTDNTSGNDISIDLTTKVVASSQITVQFSADAPTSVNLSGADFLSTVDDSGNADAAQSTTEGNGDGDAGDNNSWAVTTTDDGGAVAFAEAEISPNDVATSSTTNAFSYDVQATIGAGDTGVDRVAITVPGSFGAPTVTDVEVDGVPVAFTDNTAGNTISVDLTTKVTTSSQITVLFNADAPATQDLTGVTFLSTVDDTGIGAQFGNGYDNRVEVDFVDAEVIGGPHTNFPVLISSTLLDLRTVGNGGKVEDANGYDIIFTSDEDGTTPLAHEIESYVSSTGEIIFWVRVESLAATTKIYMFYGNSSIGTFQGDVTSNGVTGVWDNAYQGVWHLNESGNGTADEFKDSALANHGQGGDGISGDTPSQDTSSKIHNGQLFDGVSEWLEVTTDPSLDVSGQALTLSTWFNLTSGWDSTISANTEMTIMKDAKIAFRFETDGKIWFGLQTTGWSAVQSTVTSWSSGTWYKIDAVYDGVNLELFINGSTDNTLGKTGDISTGSSADLQISKVDDLEVNQGPFEGTYDDMRISSTARGAQWIETEYNNQDSPAAFYALGTATGADPGTATQSTTEGDGDGDAGDANSWTVTTTDPAAAVTSAVAEISPNDVVTSSTANAFSYDIQATISGGETGVNRVTITVPGTFGAPTVTGVQVGGVGVGYTDNTAGNAISVDLTTKVTASSKITVLFSADAPTTQDLAGANFLSTVDDSGTGDSAQSSTEGDGDGDAVDANTWAVTTGGACTVDPNGSYFEAEDYVLPLVGGSGPGTFLTQSSQAGYNGLGYLYSNNGNTTTPPENERADYTVNFTTTGTYYIWMRGYGLASSGSLFIGLDGTWVGALDEGGTYNAWLWTDSVQTGVRTINVATTGNHTINLWGREAGHKVDGIYITTDSGAIPGGTSIGIPTGAKVIDPNDCATAVTAAVAEISPNDVTTTSTANAFSYDIQATIGDSDTGVNRVTITVPGTFGAPTVTAVQVDGVGVAHTDNTAGNAISVDLTTKVTASSKITVLFSTDAPTTQDLTGVNFLSTVDDSGTAYAAQSTTEGNGDGDAVDANTWAVTTTDRLAVTSAVAEISPNDVTTSSTANAFSYDIQATISGGTTGVNRVAITVPGSFGAPTVTAVQVGGVGVAYTDNTSGNGISVDLTTKVTASSKITVLFSADAPTSVDLSGADFLSTVDDSGTGDAAQSTTEGNGDGDAGDANSWAATTTDAGAAAAAAVAEISPNDVNMSSTGNAFSYDIQATIGAGDTGVDRVVITVPASFGAPTVTDVEVDGVPVAYTDNTAGNEISVDLTTKLTTSSKITVLFNADAPTTQDLTGVTFLSIVDDSGNLNPFGNGYSYRVEVDFVDAEVSGGPHTNFPVLISSTLLDLRTVGNGGKVEDANGYDIIFTSDLAGTTQLAHEIESYVSSTGEIVFWVRIESLVATTKIYLFYGNSGIASFQGDVMSNGATGVWDNDYQGVWHLNEATDATNIDATNNTNDGTPQNSPASIAGKIDDALNFEGADKTTVDVGTAGSLDLSLYSDSTISAWVKPSTNYANSDWPNIYTYAYYGASLDIGVKEGPEEGRIEYYRNNTTGLHSDTAMNIDAWNHVVVVRGPVTTYFYLNGVADGFGSSVSIDQDNSGSHIGGHPGWKGADLLGLIDEVRVSSSPRGAQWIETEFNNQDSPAAFYVLGPPEDSSQSTTEGDGDGDAGDNNSWTVTTTDAGAAVTAAVAEISSNDVTTNSTSNAFIYDIGVTIAGGNTGVDRVAITVPGSFGTPTVSNVLIDGLSVAYTDNTSGNDISVDLTTKMTASGQITVLFDADAPITQDLTGVTFLSTVDDSATGDAAAATTEGNGDGDALDSSSWTVTTTGAASGNNPVTAAVAEISPNDVTTSTLSNAFSYDIALTIGGGDTGVDRVAITVPGSFGPGSVTDVEVDGVPVAYTDNTAGNEISVDLTTKVTISSTITVLFGADAPTTQDPTGVDFLSTVDDSGNADAAQSTTEGNGDGDVGDSNSWTVTTTNPPPAVTSAVAEINPNDVATSSTANAFSYDIQATISGSNSGVNRVAITVPGSFGAPTVTAVQVDGSPVAYTDNTAGNAISVDLTTKVTASSKITVLFSADAPTTQDPVGLNFPSTVKDSGTIYADQSTTEGNGDGDAGDNNSWVVTTTDGGPVISSAADQTFTVGDPDTLISTITITDYAVSPTITDGNDLRIRIPSSFNMTWDTSITTVTLGGPQAGKVSATLLAYEDGDRTLVLNVTSDFVAGDQITVADPQFVSFSAASAADNLELEVNDDDVVSATDDKTITILGTTLSISSAANQAFTVGDPDTLISTITITDDAVTPTITGGKGGKNIRIRIPSSFNMTWDTSIDTVTLGGPAASKVKTKLKNYEDADRTLVVDVDDDFAAGDQITISGLEFIYFSAPSAADNLELMVYNDDNVSATDDKTITIDPPTTPVIFSAADQMFNRDDPATAISTIAVSDATTPTITQTNDLRIRIPSTFNMSWDTSITTVTLGGSAAGKVDTTLLAYEDGGQTLVLNVTSDFASADYITMSDPSFANFTAISAIDNLELEVNNDEVVTATDNKTITIIGRYGISSAANQIFIVGDSATLISTITITDDAVTKTIKKKKHLRIRIPSTFNMIWDTSITTVTLGGPAASKVDTTLEPYEDGNQTLVLDVTSDFEAGDYFTIDDPQFTSFSAASAADNLELEVNDDGNVSATDDKTITISLSYAVTSAVAEISPNDVATSSTANAFSYDIGVTISGSDTGVNRVAITVPGTFGAPTVTAVQIDGSPVAYTDNTSGNDISVDLTTKVTASSKITVLFSADAPTTQDFAGVDFLSTVDDSGNADAAQLTTEGNGDADAGDLNSWTVTTTDAVGAGGGGGLAADHFAVIHDGNGINCQAEQITIEAHDSDHTLATPFNGTIKLSTTTSRGDWSLVSGAGNLVNNGKGKGHYAMHPSDSSVVVLGLRNTFVETTNIDLAHSFVSEDAGEDDDLSFARAGFNFLAGGATNTIGTQIGGKASNVLPGSQTLELQAVNTNDDTGACEAALAGATTIELAFRCENPSTCTGRQVNIGGTDIPDTDASAFLNYSGVSLDFGNSSDSTADFTMSYPDVGKVQLHARYRFSPSGEWMLGASNEFVVRPFALKVSATSNPGAVNPAGAIFTSAGTNFSANVSAVLWDAADDIDNDGIADNHGDINPGNNADLSDNLVALNYGREASVEQVLLTAALDQPAGGANPGLSGGTIVSIFSSGAGTTSTLRYDEVGIIEISAAISDGDYLGIGTTETSYILGNSSYVGRFNPARYAVTSSSIIPACSATFTYARQPFTGTMTIEAQAGAAAGNVRTANYRAGFVTLDPASELVFVNNQTAAAYDAKTVTYNENFDSGTTGAAVLALQFRWDMGQQAPATSTVQNTAVTDEVTTLAAAPVSLGTSPTRYGRVNISSAAGSELVNLAVPMRTEYYVDASTGFVTNTSDFCSSGAALSLTNFAENLGAGETCVEDSGSPGVSGAGCAIAGSVAQRFDDPLIAGEFNLFLEAPGIGNDGSASVDANVPDWLEFDWDTGAPGLEDPSGRITFGIYGGDKNQVYRRELY